MRSLKYYIAENSQIDKIVETTSNSQRRKLLKEYLKGKYEDYLDKLELICEDPKAKSLLDDAFGGPLGDVSLRFSEESISVRRLMPTQNSIGLESSLKHLLTKADNIKKIYGDVVELVHPLITFNKTYVIDGHHRWSEILCANPDAKALCINYDGDISVMQMLKATQGAIAASVDYVPKSKTKGDNIYKCSDKDIIKYIEDNLSDETCESFKRIARLDSKDDVVNYIFENVKELVNNHPTIPNAPSREKMPQTFKGNGLEKDGALIKMKNGNVLKI